MPAASPPVPLSELLAAATAIVWRDAGLIAQVGTSDGRSFACVALDPETRVPDAQWPTGIAASPVGAVGVFLDALRRRGHAVADARRADLVRTLATEFPAGVVFTAAELSQSREDREDNADGITTAARRA